MIPSICIFLILYFFLATEKIEKSTAAILSASAVILFGLISFDEAVNAIDLNVIFLLIGMMSCVEILADTGFFEWIAMLVAKKAKGNPILIFCLLLAVTMILSALLDNVTTIIILVPVTILITQILEIPTVPFVVFEAIASNIGGTATLIGDPPNIIIGSKAELSFNDFLFQLAPCIIVIAIIFIIASVTFLRKSLIVPDSIKIRVIESYPELAIRDKKKMYKSLAVFALIFIGFLVHHHIGVPPGIIALAGMALMLLVTKSDNDNVFKKVEWDAILFFIGLFIVIGALETNGVLNLLANGMLKICGDNLFVSCMVILWGSAIFSAVLDNIPFVMAMMPLVQKMVVANGGSATGPNPLLWALALGACLGGNGTLIGASANIIASKICNKNDYSLSFVKFLKYGFPVMILSLIISTIYLWLRYF